ncbi:MAG: hypothetical protein V4633_13305 [Pseudomonadota bacterium]
MKKIPSLFQRNYDGDRRVRNEVVPGSEWVIAGEGVATRKWDGMAVLIRFGEVFKRYDAKAGRTPPRDFMPAQPAADPESGHWPGWVPAVGPDSARIMEAVAWARENVYQGGAVPDGSYEACGPKIGTRHGANPEKLTEHILVPHGRDVLDCPRTYDALRFYLATRSIEGIVWHHPDGRMVKIKTVDFPAATPAQGEGT